MKRLLLFLTAIVLLVSYADAKRVKKRPKKSADYVAKLDSVLRVIQHSYEKAVDSLKKQKDMIGIDLQSAAVTFKITTSVTGGGELNILIVKAGKKWTKDKESSVTFNLEKSTDKSDFVKSEKLYTQLVNIIVSAAKKLNQIAEEGILPSLPERSFDVDLSFGLTRNTSGGIEFKFFSDAASFGLDGELSKAVEQSISLKFKLIQPKT